MLSPLVAANSKPQLKLEISPIECSIDELNNGVNTITQVVPDYCIVDGELPVPTDPSPSPGPSSPDGQTPPGQTDERIDSIRQRYPEIFLANSPDSILFVPFATGHDSTRKGIITPTGDIIQTEKDTTTDEVVFNVLIAILFALALVLMTYFLARRRVH